MTKERLYKNAIYFAGIVFYYGCKFYKLETVAARIKNLNIYLYRFKICAYG